MFDTSDPLRVEFLDGHRWVLTEDFAYRDDRTGHLVIVPAGFETDFASIPRAVWPILPPVDDYGKAAVIHDWLYVAGEDSRGTPVSRAEADGIFERAMKELGVGWARRRLMYRAVRLFAGGLWEARRARQRQQSCPTVPENGSRMPQERR